MSSSVEVSNSNNITSFFLSNDNTLVSFDEKYTFTDPLQPYVNHDIKIGQVSIVGGSINVCVNVCAEFQQQYDNGNYNGFVCFTSLYLRPVTDLYTSYSINYTNGTFPFISNNIYSFNLSLTGTNTIPYIPPGMYDVYVNVGGYEQSGGSGNLIGLRSATITGWLDTNAI